MSEENQNTSSTEEKIYYNEGGIKITSKRAILNNTTYVLENISSVSSKVIHHAAIPSPLKGCFIFFIFIFAITAIAGFGELVGSRDGDPGVLIFSLAILGILIYCLMKFGKGTPASTSHAVKIGSNSGETDALVSEDKDYIDKIVNAINDAIIDNPN